MKKVCKFFGIEKLGWLEMALALYPIMSMYTYGRFKLYIFIPIILDIILVCSNKKTDGRYDMRPVKFLLSYMIIHFFVWIMIMPSTPSYYYNSHFAFFSMLVSLIIILPYVDFTKLCSSVNLVGVVCACGLVYHAITLMHSSTVSPIPLFFLPSPDSTSRLYGMLNRPLSFFAEPQTYVSYMIIPLFLSLTRKNLLWAIIVSITILMSGSTTGIAMIAVMFCFYILTTHSGVVYRILLICALVGLGYFLITSEFAMTGLDKLKSTNLTETARIANGFLIARTIPMADFILGVPYANASDYCYASGNTSTLIFDDGGSLFLPAFWITLLQYGIIGLLLYLSIYFKILKKDKRIVSYWICIVISLFSNSDFISDTFIFACIFCYTFVYHYNSLNDEKNIYAHNAICQ